eukprot:2122443-Alexandrium_andersonii.AAC.1
MAGVLQDSSGFLSYWFDQLQSDDQSKVQAPAGDPPKSTHCVRLWPSWSASGFGERCSPAKHPCP